MDGMTITGAFSLLNYWNGFEKTLAHDFQKINPGRQMLKVQISHRPVFQKGIVVGNCAAQIIQHLHRRGGTSLSYYAYPIARRVG